MGIPLTCASMHPRGHQARQGSVNCPSFCGVPKRKWGHEFREIGFLVACSIRSAARTITHTELASRQEALVYGSEDVDRDRG